MKQNKTPESIKSYAVCYCICSYESNSMKSKNPYSGIYESNTSRTLDTSCSNPASSQGGLVICQKK